MLKKHQVEMEVRAFLAGLKKLEEVSKHAYLELAKRGYVRLKDTTPAWKL
jgi:hypothetical protein